MSKLSSQEVQEIPQERREFAKRMVGSLVATRSGTIYRVVERSHARRWNGEPEAYLKLKVVRGGSHRQQPGDTKEVFVSKWDSGLAYHAIPGTGAPTSREFGELSIHKAELSEMPGSAAKFFPNDD